MLTSSSEKSKVTLMVLIDWNNQPHRLSPANEESDKFKPPGIERDSIMLPLYTRCVLDSAFQKGLESYSSL